MNPSPLVYLAGPITGLSFAGCTGWREEAIKALALSGITGITPMRCKHYLERLTDISGHGREYAHMSPLSGSRGVVTRDYFDVHRADVILVNLLGCDRVSIGTMFEMAWAFHKRTPIVAMMEKEDRSHIPIGSENRAWLAGLIDGEGCIYIARREGKDGPTYSARVIVTQANLELLEKARRAANGVGSITEARRTRTGVKFWRWNVMSREATNLLREVSQWLTVKRVHAELAIELQETNGVSGHPKRTFAEHAKRDAIYRAWRQAQHGEPVTVHSPKPATLITSGMDHMFVEQTIGYRVGSLAEAIDIVKAILLPDVRPGEKLHATALPGSIDCRA